MERDGEKKRRETEVKIEAEKKKRQKIDMKTQNN
jgi:hypothetical protein